MAGGTNNSGTNGAVLLCRCVCSVLGHHHSVCDEIAVPGASVPLLSGTERRAVPACLGCHTAVHQELARR
ncbi:hypothetical protein [Amycolatopsis sp. FDAARGOS 1241]|uniref:hypothetical protein n=1 Tax=Amycolatopsis sp. FDAARGOS 1241 TaxID=2778070 RepID=UPI0019525D62|nr:hypothetical protein [Amycolatopsis sp. FDAARGOS 1241]QRP49828.1 hypothetical protein I6J71_20070 [Amycolatopsis sp. FDAARGOS 1241]